MQLKEQIEWLQNTPIFNNSWLLNGGENEIYQAQGSGAGGSYDYKLYHWLNNSAVNKWQRYLGRVLYLDNGIAQTAVNKLTIMALGSGMKICCANESKQAKLDEWVKRNHWKKKEAEAFKRRTIDGEIFFRVFDDEDIRFVDPDLVYCSAALGKPFAWQGVISDANDQEEITGFEIHEKNYVLNTQDQTGKIVPVEEMQHRKLNSHFGARRGFSLLLPIATDLFNVDKLTNNLMATSNVLAKIAFWRKHKANKASVQQFRADITNQQAIASALSQRPPLQNIEEYPPGS